MLHVVVCSEWNSTASRYLYVVSDIVEPARLQVRSKHRDYNRGCWESKCVPRLPTVIFSCPYKIIIFLIMGLHFYIMALWNINCCYYIFNSDSNL